MSYIFFMPDTQNPDRNKTCIVVQLKYENVVFNVRSNGRLKKSIFGDFFDL